MKPFPYCMQAYILVKAHHPHMGSDEVTQSPHVTYVEHKLTGCLNSYGEDEAGMKPYVYRCTKVMVL